MDKIFVVLLVTVFAAQAYVVPGGGMANIGMLNRGMGLGNPYMDPLGISQLAGGVANSLGGLGSSLGGIGGLQGPLGGPLTRSIGGMGGMMVPGGYGNPGLMSSPGLSMDYGFYRG